MSRENTRRSEATTNSFASFGSDFDPEHEALASTKHFENSPRLPEMKGSARKQINNFEDEEPDYAIDTSALERAFPEFSPVGTSEDDTEESISVEAGRGINKPTRRLDDSRNSLMSIENSVRSSSPAVRLDYPASHTPPKSAMRVSSRRTTSESLRRDAQLRQASLAHKENRDPLSSKTARKDQRRTLSEMHAKVRDSYDGSFIADERPQPVASSTRATRFGNVNLSHQIADAVERASQEAYAKEMRRGKLPSNLRNVSGSGAGDTATMQSFLLPDLPNLSELVSGVYEDGTPVYTRQSRARATRFVSPPNDGADMSMTREHIPLDAIPIPEDEKALFVSLRLLQDKVSELERAKSDAERKIDEMRQENAALKAGRPHRKDKHGRSRVYESEDDDHRRDVGSHYQKLEAANLALQNQLDVVERKTQMSEATLKKLNRERDMAVSQLGIAYLESRDLKSENESLRQENAELKAQLAKFVSKTREDTGRSEATSATEASVESGQVYTQRSEDISRATKDHTSKSTRSKRTGGVEDSRTKISKQVDKEISRLEKERAEEALFSIELPRTRASSSRAERSQTQTQTGNTKAKKQPNTGKQRVKRVIVEEVDLTEPLDSATEDATGHTKKSSATEQELTLLSLVDEHEIAQLRKTLEEERLARRRRQSISTKIQNADEMANSTRQSVSKSVAPRKSSLKESKAPIARPASAMGDLTATSKVSMAEADSNLSVPIERPRRHSDHSISTAQRRRRHVTDDMTSALILPDITLHHADLAAEDPSRLPQAAQKALDSATQHDGKNCTVCKRCLPGDSRCDHTHETVKIPKPVPVSERMPEPSVYNEEPTLRPAQSPGVALATVLKALEDELSHLKIQLVTYQGAYNKLDASLSKRQRKSLTAKIEKLLKDIDMKADQIYALYDVLEGQKQNGNEMTEQEMEVTLQSIGIDTGATTRAADVTATTDKSSHKNNDTDLEDEELPWEGIESTMDVTGRIGN
ncbi:hypothetical protein CNMCM5793_002102 [Aspergillus hiratsukae]|uniref:Cep57 centrosome microtubule-binding domain-containing protein n=1 Tax=Aspergillus hiratsukae TaxID=1194566 RepID=A0A8H6PCF3_9EURO|nr:hypothetical protein CNMCM5793_002102 [Aspergillus hiratsukae]KAF7165812.1 hypothetical protein CNMCM6106_001857 [Aspergillus hiratsukae]